MRASVIAIRSTKSTFPGFLVIVLDARENFEAGEGPHVLAEFDREKQSFAARYAHCLIESRAPAWTCAPWSYVALRKQAPAEDVEFKKGVAGLMMWHAYLKICKPSPVRFSRGLEQPSK